MVLAGAGWSSSSAVVPACGALCLAVACLALVPLVAPRRRASWSGLGASGALYGLRRGGGALALSLTPRLWMAPARCGFVRLSAPPLCLVLIALHVLAVTCGCAVQNQTTQSIKHHHHQHSHDHSHHQHHHHRHHQHHPPPPPASISRRGAELEAALFDALPAVAGWREPFTEEVHDQIRLPRHLGGTHLQPPSESAA